MTKTLFTVVADADEQLATYRFHHPRIAQHWQEPRYATAAEAMYFDNQPLAHVVAWEQRLRNQRIAVWPVLQAARRRYAHYRELFS